MISEKVKYFLHFLIQGKKERDQCYKPILEELDGLFPNRSKDRYFVFSCCFLYSFTNLKYYYLSGVSTITCPLIVIVKD